MEKSRPYEDLSGKKYTFPKCRQHSPPHPLHFFFVAINYTEQKRPAVSARPPHKCNEKLPPELQLPERGTRVFCTVERYGV